MMELWIGLLVLIFKTVNSKDGETQYNYMFVHDKNVTYSFTDNLPVKSIEPQVYCS